MLKIFKKFSIYFNKFYLALARQSIPGIFWSRYQMSKFSGGCLYRNQLVANTVVLNSLLY